MASDDDLSRSPTWPPHSLCMGVFSGVVLRSPFANVLLNAERLLPYPRDHQVAQLDAVVGWGQKPGAERARAFAARHGLPFMRAEDAFLRSVGLGVNGEGPLGIVLDDEGMYYDARQPSRLERLIAGAEALEETKQERSRACVTAIREHGLSKYNRWTYEKAPWRDTRERVLVVDQTAGDLAISKGLADASCFERMLDDALDRHPNAEIVVKIHPDVLAGHKQGHLEHVSGEKRVRLVAEGINPIRLLEEVDHVYVVTSQLGLEALLVGKPVHCYGMPFYAGWGLTEDVLHCDRRGQSRSLEQLFHAAYIDYARYVHPETGTAGQLEDVIDHLARQRSRFAINAGRRVCFGVPRGYRSQLRSALDGPRSTVGFARLSEPNRREHSFRGAEELHWTNVDALLTAEPEDGQPASVAPGPLDLLLPPKRPLPPSFAFRGRAGLPCLEALLSTSALSRADLASADEAMAALLAQTPQARPVSRRMTRTYILVLGTADEPSGRGWHDDLLLLRDLHARAPATEIAYAPPANRWLDPRPALCARLAGAKLVRGSLLQWVRAASEVHTRKATTGLWALMAGRPLHVHDTAWYAGRGLTVDLVEVPRRERLSVRQLVAAALIAWPQYQSFRTGYATDCWTVIRERRQLGDGGVGTF